MRDAVVLAACAGNESAIRAERCIEDVRLRKQGAPTEAPVPVEERSAALATGEHERVVRAEAHNVHAALTPQS